MWGGKGVSVTPRHHPQGGSRRGRRARLGRVPGAAPGASRCASHDPSVCAACSTGAARARARRQARQEGPPSSRVCKCARSAKSATTQKPKPHNKSFAKRELPHNAAHHRGSGAHTEHVSRGRLSPLSPLSPASAPGKRPAAPLPSGGTSATGVLGSMQCHMNVKGPQWSVFNWDRRCRPSRPVQLECFVCSTFLLRTPRRGCLSASPYVPSATHLVLHVL